MSHSENYKRLRNFERILIMPISSIVRLAEPRLTNQQLADMALTSWQEARRAAKRGDLVSCALHRRESLRLLDNLDAA